MVSKENVREWVLWTRASSLPARCVQCFLPPQCRRCDSTHAAHVRA